MTLSTYRLDPQGSLERRDDQILGTTTHNRGITERKNLKIKVRTMQKHLDDAPESMTDALVLYDADAIWREASG